MANKVFLVGRLTKNPGIHYSQGEKQMAIARFTLAVDRKVKKAADGSQDQQTADFIPCIAFDKLAEFAEKYLLQGMKMVVIGRLQTGSYVNREGQRIYTTDVIVEELDFAEKKPTSGQQQTGNVQPDGFMNIPDGVEDAGLPFN